MLTGFFFNKEVTVCCTVPASQRPREVSGVCATQLRFVRLATAPLLFDMNYSVFRCGCQVLYFSWKIDGPKFVLFLYLK